MKSKEGQKVQMKEKGRWRKSECKRERELNIYQEKERERGKI